MATAKHRVKNPLIHDGKRYERDDILEADEATIKKFVEKDSLDAEPFTGKSVKPQSESGEASGEGEGTDGGDAGKADANANAQGNTGKSGKK